MIMIRDDILAIKLITYLTPNDSFKICAIANGRLQYKVFIAVVYRLILAKLKIPKALCHQLDLLSVKYSKVIIVSDFNLHTATRTEIYYVQLFALEHNLSQLVIESNRGILLYWTWSLLHHTSLVGN